MLIRKNSLLGHSKYCKCLDEKSGLNFLGKLKNHEKLKGVNSLKNMLTWCKQMGYKFN